MVVQNFPAGLNLFGCRFLSRNQIRLKKISVFSHRGVGTTPLRAGGRDSVVKKNKTKYLKGVPKVFTPKIFIIGDENELDELAR